MISIQDQLMRALADDPGFAGPDPDGSTGRAAELKAFELGVGVLVPADVRAFMVDIGFFRIAQRVFNASGVKRKSVLSSDAVAAAPGSLAGLHQTLVPFFVDESFTDSQRSWSGKLVPLLVDNDDEYFVLDFSYKDVEPPLISIRMESPWFSGRARFVAPSFLDYLRNPIWESEYPPDEEVDDASEDSRAWSSWFQENVIAPK